MIYILTIEKNMSLRRSQITIMSKAKYSKKYIFRFVLTTIILLSQLIKNQSIIHIYIVMHVC